MPFFDSKTGSFSPLNIEKKWSIGWFIWRFFGPWIKNYREKSVDRVGIIEKNWSIPEKYREKLVDSFCKLLIFYIYLPVDNGIPFPFLRYPFFSLYTLHTSVPINLSLKVAPRLRVLWTLRQSQSWIDTYPPFASGSLRPMLRMAFQNVISPNLDINCKKNYEKTKRWKERKCAIKGKNSQDLNHSALHWTPFCFQGRHVWKKIALWINMAFYFSSTPDRA